MVGVAGSIVWDFGTLLLYIYDTVLAELSFNFKVTEDCTLLKNANCTMYFPALGSAAGSVSQAVKVSKSFNSALLGGNCQGTVILELPYNNN
jgi:hypothetical protein